MHAIGIGVHLVQSIEGGIAKSYTGIGIVKCYFDAVECCLLMVVLEIDILKG